MIKVGIIGYGRWGKILGSKLEKFCDIKFTCRSKDTYLGSLRDVDWVFVSTPNETHFHIVLDCLNAGKNVFCEKPLTPTYEQSKILFDIAKSKGVKLYVDDVQNFRKVNYKLTDKNLIQRRKQDGFNHSYYKTKDLLYRLTYHDIYYLYDKIKDKKIKDIKLINNKQKLHFDVHFENMNIEFLYDSNFKGKRVHDINGVSLIGDDDILHNMLEKVLSEDVDFEYNKKISLFTSNFIDEINKKLFKNIAVIGGGIFGCTAAWMLAKKGYQVDLYEKNDDIISQASFINQYRLHRGYHYPRSKETAQSSINGETSFLKEYGDAIINGKIEHYYCIAKDDSKVSRQDYLKFLDDLNLQYEEKEIDFINKESIDLSVKVNELLFDPKKLKEICWRKLKKYEVNVNLNTEFNNSKPIYSETYDYFHNGKRVKYDYIINATYANLNNFFKDSDKKDYQFELCEKPVIKLPKQYKNKSVVIMDGPFMCIDPLGDTDNHVMGNVVHAIHKSNVGKKPEYENHYNKVLNKGIVKRPHITLINHFINSAKHFFKDIDKAEHIGSMFTFRTVLPNKDNDDARPTLVEEIGDKMFNLFSGKIGTCVDAATEVIKRIK